MLLCAVRMLCVLLCVLPRAAVRVNGVSTLCATVCVCVCVCVAIGPTVVAVCATSGLPLSVRRAVLHVDRRRASPCVCDTVCVRPSVN